MHFIYLSLEIFTLCALYCYSSVYCKPLPRPNKLIHLLPMSSRVRYKRQAQGYGIWVRRKKTKLCKNADNLPNLQNPMFHNTEYLPYTDMGNVHFWSDGWLLPPNVYASDLGPFEFYPVGTWIDFLPGLSDSPAVLGGRGSPQATPFSQTPNHAIEQYYTGDRAVHNADPLQHLTLNPLINSPALLYPDPGNVRFWGGGYRPVLAGSIYGMPISMPPTAGFLQPLLHGQQNYINSQTLASYNPLNNGKKYNNILISCLKRLQKSLTRPLRSQSPNRVGSTPAGPPISPVCGFTPSGQFGIRLTTFCFCGPINFSNGTSGFTFCDCSWGVDFSSTPFSREIVQNKFASSRKQPKTPELLFFSTPFTNEFHCLDTAKQQRQVNSMENSDNNDLLKSVEELDDYFQNAIDLIHPDHYGFDSSIVHYLRDDRIARANAMSKNGVNIHCNRKRVSRAKWENLKYLNDHFRYTISSIWEKLEKANPEKLLESEENMIDQKQLKKFEKWEKLTEESKKDDAIMQKLKYKKISKKSNKKRANVKKENGKLKSKQKLHNGKTVNKEGDKKKLAEMNTTTATTTDRYKNKNNNSNNKTNNGALNKVNEVKSGKAEVSYNKFEFAKVTGFKVKHKNKKKKKKQKGDAEFAAEKFTGRDYARLLEKVERRQEKLQELEKNDPKKAEKVKQQFIWDSAVKRAEGLKIKDDRNMLKKGLKMKEKRKASKKKKWQERKEAVARVNKKKQDVRKANIQQRIEQKKKKRLAEARKRKGKC
ncbi:Surfeit locus protein 6 [Trichinella spiralis]|uniref:Surfeit locus protein 6 n=1 Tax=Trichinella spiralis TaxID=6334 RepID=A0A0V1AT34_TRISP|nr:Surfeit locus protein 6 [Trichinella spiralis]